jgi:hypothetical protein
MRLRYLKPEVIAAYQRAAIEPMMCERGRSLPRIGSLMVWLRRNRSSMQQPVHLGQVGLVDRVADPPYGDRWIKLDKAALEVNERDTKEREEDAGDLENSCGAADA